MIDDEQISRFFNLQSSPEETAILLAFFDRHPEILNKYLSQADWENFKSTNKLDPDFSNKLWSNIAADSLKQKSHYLSFRMKAGIAAACLLLLTGTYFYLKPGKQIHKIVSDNTLQEYIQNTGIDTMFVTLKDKSTVKLLPQSSLAYSKDFSQKEREIQLKGEALFSVNHGPIPFIIKTDQLEIIDKGTVFSVKSFEKENIIKVRLLEGCVIVNSHNKSYTLKPGDILLYNKTDKTCSLSIQRDNPPKSIIPKTASGSNKNTARNNWYMFNNQSLSSVFDQLAKIYNTKIDYSNADINGLTFIGHLDKTDSLEVLLESIATLNKLRVEKTGEGFRIYK